MKNLFVMFVMIVAGTSCAGFHHAHYRHVKMVDADYTSFDGNRQIVTHRKATQSLADTIQPVRKTDLSVAKVEVAEVKCNVEKQDSASPKRTLVRSIVAEQTGSQVQDIRGPGGLRHDWSLLIATLFIIAGLMLFVYAGIFLAATPLSLFVRILFSIILASAAVKMLVQGISIFANRFRSGKNYKET